MSACHDILSSFSKSLKYVFYPCKTLGQIFLEKKPVTKRVIVLLYFRKYDVTSRVTGSTISIGGK